MDPAIRANVIISGLDARGLWTDPTFDASSPKPQNPFDLKELSN